MEKATQGYIFGWITRLLPWLFMEFPKPKTSWKTSCIFLNDAMFWRCFWKNIDVDVFDDVLQNAKHRANDASNDVNRPPLYIWGMTNTKLARMQNCNISSGFKWFFFAFRAAWSVWNVITRMIITGRSHLSSLWSQKGWMEADPCRLAGMNGHWGGGLWSGDSPSTPSSSSTPW